jgi:hypothetical protein
LPVVEEVGVMENRRWVVVRLRRHLDCGWPIGGGWDWSAELSRLIREEEEEAGEKEKGETTAVMQRPSC